MNQGGHQPHSTKSLSELMGRALTVRDARLVPPPPPQGPSAVEALLATREAVQDRSSHERSLVEVNVQRLPFAILTSKKSGSKTPIVVEEAFHRGGEVETRTWRASPNTEYGLPGPSAYLVFRALERLVLGRTLGRGAPLENPQTFEFQDISRLLGMAQHSDNRDQIRLDLKRIKGTTFINRGMLRKRLAGKPGARRGRALRSDREEVVSLIERLLFRNEELVDGSVATQNQVWFGSFYLDSVNSGYVKPFDWDLWQSFKRPAARRLFEILDLRMNATPEAEILDFDYDKLAALIPLTPQKFLSLARAVVDPLLGELRGPVLESYTWREIDGAWMLHLSPSPSYRRRRADQASPDLDLRAHELALKLGDLSNLPYYKRVAGKVDRQWIDIALSETKQAEQAGQVRNRGAYFTKVLREILTRRGLPVPYGA
jgi:hypothetical protein